MSHKYRAAIGRESPRPASRGIWRKLNRGVEIADRLFRLPREHRRDNSAFCRLLCANKRRWLPGIRQKGAAANRQTNFCTNMRRNNLPHNNTRVPRRSAFWPKPQKAPKALFNPRHQAKMPEAFFDGADSVGRKSVSPHAGEGQKAGVYVDIKLKIKHRNLCKEISVPYLYL